MIGSKCLDNLSQLVIIINIVREIGFTTYLDWKACGSWEQWLHIHLRIVIDQVRVSLLDALGKNAAGTPDIGRGVVGWLMQNQFRRPIALMVNMLRHVWLFGFVYCDYV